MGLVVTLVAGSMLGCAPKQAVTPPPPPAPTGAWVPEVIFSQEPSATTAVARLEANEIQVFAFSVTDPAIRQKVESTASLGYERSFGSYAELTFNPVGPVFPGTTRLNPFSVPAIREAFNWLIDRNYVAEEIYGGMSVPRYLPINGAFPDYVKLIGIARALELKYAHNPQKAKDIITAEMKKLGASLVSGKWMYKNKPVELVFVIRTEDQRRQSGDYIATLVEDLGFKVDRQYKTGAEASPIWLAGDPAKGLFHMYTGGWVTTAISRDQADNFDFFYTNRGLAFPLWQAYKPSTEFDEVADRLGMRDFTTVQQRTDLFAKALELAMKDSARVWLVDNIGISPRRADVKVAADLAGGIYGAWLWGPSLRYADKKSAPIKVAMPSILPEPWNPLDGSNWVYDTMIVRGTGELGTMPDPFTGLSHPQRIEKGEVFIKEGLPVGKTLNWVTLNFVPANKVPADAWADWDAKEQRFITVGERFPDGVEALRKSVVHYPANLFETTWHDGSKLSIADFVMNMILTFDRAKEDSKIFDAARKPAFDSFMKNFRGVKIVSQSPLVIETYSDFYVDDAELNVTAWFPYYDRGPGSWHGLSLGILAEAEGKLAFSSAKSKKAEVEWTNYIAGPSLEILAAQLTKAKGENYIPYKTTLSKYITAADATARWTNIQNWYTKQKHFWIGTGPFYLEKVFPVEKVVHLKKYDGYKDLSSKWERFGEPMIATVEVSGPAQVKIGTAAAFDLAVKFKGQPYKKADMSQVKYLVFDARGELVFSGDAANVSDGLWRVSLTAEQTAKLTAGANRLEVAVAPLVVSIPSFGSKEFVTAP
jgi:peptide/nickel transport system substrate-binding protein